MGSEEKDQFDKLTAKLWNYLVDVKKAAAYCNESEKQWNNNRWLGRGCPYLKIGGKVYYDLRDVKEYFRGRVQRIVPGG